MPRSFRSVRARLAAAALPLALGTSGAFGAARAPATRLQIRLFTFAPKAVTVAAGDTLVVSNADDTEHTITFGAPDAVDARLAAHTLAKGATARVVPTTPGAYPFFCERHPFMTGTLTVTK